MLPIWFFIWLQILPNASVGVPSTEEVSRQIFLEINRYRQSIGLPALKAKRELNAIALKHSRNMASGQLPFSHQGFQSRVDEIKAYAKKDWRVAENLYATFNTRSIAQHALRDWLDSPGHKENLCGRFIFTGIGVARSQSGEYFITQLYVGRR